MCFLKEPLLGNQACGHFRWGHLNQLLKPGPPFFLSRSGERVLCFGMGPCFPDADPLTAIFGPLIWPQGKGWPEMVRLREEVREEILKHCGERSIEIILAGPPRE